jgi:DNA-binding MarR family transcriptional regulator
LPTLTPHRRSNILRVMNYSDAETYGNRTDEELLDAAMPLLQAVGAALHAAILQISQTYHLTPAQVKVLLQLGSRGQMTMGEVATGLCASMPAVSELVDRLVDAGHLVRATDPGDRRRVLIEATPEAQRVGAHFCELRRAQLRYALAQFAPEERSVFVRSLEALLAGLTYDEQSRSIQCPQADAAVGATVSVDHTQRAEATVPQPGPDQAGHANGKATLDRSSQGTN